MLLEKIANPKAEDLEVEDFLQIDIQHTVAQLYARTGQTAEAIKVLEQIVKYETSNFGKEAHRSLLDTQHELGMAYYKIGNLQEARRVLEQVVQEATKIMKAEDLNLLFAEDELALVCLTLGDMIEATRLLERVTQIKSKHLKPDNRSRLRSEFRLAQCYYKSGRYDESLRLARSIEHFAQNAPGSSIVHGMTKVIRQCLEAMEEIKLSGESESRHVGREEAKDEDENEE